MANPTRVFLSLDLSPAAASCCSTKPGYGKYQRSQTQTTRRATVFNNRLAQNCYLQPTRRSANFCFTSSGGS